MRSFGLTKTNEIHSLVEEIAESISIKGYYVLSEHFLPVFCDELKSKIDRVYQQQVEEFPLDKLDKIQELDMVRMPFFYDKSLTSTIIEPIILDVVSKVLGSAYQLHLQNSIINRPTMEHFQTSWHRDLPYQDWVISKPLALNAFVCLTDFTETNGATEVLPFTQKIDYFPSQNYVNQNSIKLTAPKGSIIFFDSMIFHRATKNVSDNTRYGLNHMYVVPILKQQMDIPVNLKDINDPLLEKILGFNYKIPTTVLEYRELRYKKQYEK
jgi:ectoine hydroxylase-related dioxygenase (phytanoyl-CoA dioxygenase family)